MNFLEKDLEDIIFKTDNDLLFEHGLFIDGQKKRQVRIGNYGIADLITCSRRECDFIHIPSLIHSEYIFKQLALFNIYTYSYEFDGIQFEKHNDYILVNNGWEGAK